MKQKRPSSAKRIAGKVSVEALSHFSCGSCGKWWTIGDAPREKARWFCPWCGKENALA